MRLFAIHIHGESEEHDARERAEQAEQLCDERIRRARSSRIGFSRGCAALRLFPCHVREVVEVAARQAKDRLQDRDRHDAAQTVDAERLHCTIETVDRLARRSVQRIVRPLQDAARERRIFDDQTDERAPRALRVVQRLHELRQEHWPSREIAALMDSRGSALANAIHHRRVLAENLVIEALYAERDLVALVMQRLDRVGGIGSVLDRSFRRSRGRVG